MGGSEREKPPLSKKNPKKNKYQGENRVSWLIAITDKFEFSAVGAVWCLQG